MNLEAKRQETLKMKMKQNSKYADFIKARKVKPPYDKNNLYKDLTKMNYGDIFSNNPISDY